MSDDSPVRTEPVPVPVERVTALVERVLAAVGTPTDVAAVVTRHLVNASLTGYDSHGIIQLPGYLRQVAEGTVDPAARPVTGTERPSTAAVDGRRAWGMYAADHCMRLAVAKARATGVGAVSLGNSPHIGRLGQYAEDAADQGMIGMITFGEGQPGHFLAVPYGGVERALSTNPVAAGVPTGDDRPFVMDFATTTIANARTWVYRDRGEPLPDGVALDAAGVPTSDPAAYLDGGSLVIFGGHKGYGLSLLTCLLGALNGAYGGGDNHLAGSFFLAVDPSAFTEATGYRAATRSFLDGVKATTPGEGYREVLVPGDTEARQRSLRGVAGIPVSSQARAEIARTCRGLGVDCDL